MACQLHSLMATAKQNRDIVVIGASAGGVEALSELISALPKDLPATLLIVQHLQAFFPSKLPELLASRSGMHVSYAVHGMPISPGEIVVAPPDNHLTVRPGYLQVVRGPRENGHRPSVDALFRTAARAYGPRVIGVVLTGWLDCGTAGLLSIKARGGIALVQDPAQANVPDMPKSAIAHVQVDHVARLRELAADIARYVSEPAGEAPEQVAASLLQLEGEEPAAPADIVCPSCQGRLTEATLNGFAYFRCHVGHSFTLQSVTAEQADQMERALWAAVRALEEGGTIARRIAKAALPNMRPRLLEKADVQFLHADRIRQILLSPDLLVKMDAEEAIAQPSNQ
jgi:two-component system chemotaxis response regulator CheB